MKREMYSGQSDVADTGWSAPRPGHMSLERSRMLQAAAAAAAGGGGSTPNHNQNYNRPPNINTNNNSSNSNSYGTGKPGNAPGLVGTPVGMVSDPSPVQDTMVFNASEYDDLRTKKLLDAFIHDFLIKSNLNETAQSFEREAKLLDVEKRLDPSHDVPEGFLYEWWQIFWDVFNARTHRGGSDVAKKYFEQQLQRQRQEHTYRGVTMHVARVQQTAEQKGFYQHEMFDPMEFASIASMAANNQFNISNSVAQTAQPSVPSSASSANFPGYTPQYNSNTAPMATHSAASSQQQQQPQQPIKPQPQRQQNTHPSSVQQHHHQMQQHLQGFYNGVPGVPNGGYYTPSMNPYINTQQAQQAACMGSNPVPNSIPLASNSGPAGTGTVPTNSHNTANNVNNNSDNGNTNNGSNINVNGNEGIRNNEHMTPNSSSSYAINMVAPTQIPSSGQAQAPYSKPSSLSQQFGSIPTYINMNIPNSAPVMPSQRNSQTQIPHNQSAALAQGMLSAPSYSSHLSNNIGVNNMPMNSMNTVPGSNVNGMNHNTNPSFEMSSMDGLYNYQKELLMLEKENKKVLSIAKETSLSSGSTPQFLTLSTSGNAGNKKGSNPMLPPNSSQIATPPNQSPLNVGTAPAATAVAPKKRKYTKRVKDFKKSQSAPNTPNTTALTPGSGNRNNIPSSLNPVYEHLSANNSPRDKTPKGNLVNNSPFTLNTEASTENGKAPAGNKRARKNSSTRQLSVSSTTTTNKPKKVAAKKTPVDITTTPQNNIEEEESTGASSKDPGSNNSLGLLPHNALTDPTPHTDFDPMSIDPALNASAAFDYADNEDSMLGTLETASFAKKGDTQGDSNDEFAKDEKNSEKIKLDQSGFNLDFLDPNNSYNDFNFLNWQ